MMQVHETVKGVREYFINALQRGWFVTDKTGVKTVEMIGACFIADEPAIFGTPNEQYIKNEIEWYKSMSLNVHDIPGGPPAIWKQVSDKDGFVNSNYGWCIWSSVNGHQYEHVVEELKNNPESRRAVMIYTRPNMWDHYNYNGRSDFMCTNAVQYMIRDGKLYAVVQMRSNDVVYGYKNDYAWQKYVLDYLASDLKVPAGDIIWNVGSLHVYERHFDLVK